MTEERISKSLKRKWVSLFYNPHIPEHRKAEEDLREAGFYVNPFSVHISIERIEARNQGRTYIGLDGIAWLVNSQPE